MHRCNAVSKSNYISVTNCQLAVMSLRLEELQLVW